MQTIVSCVLLVGVLCVRTMQGIVRPSRIVHIDQGPVRGYKDLHYDVFTFHSIPYATAPTGKDRFKAPRPPPVWEEPLEAVNLDIICPQIIRQGTIMTQNPKEDCLIANIYVPDTDADNIPVIVYVHSGGYGVGYGDMVNPRPLVNTKKVIIVTFNYRLAGHGFLCLGTEDIPGNAGSKDQVALLRWVRKNIASFGGNPDDMTLIGSSAGASSVDLLMLSKMSRGIFNKIVPESGSNLGAFSTQPDPIHAAKMYAKLLGNDKNFKSITELEEFLKSLSVQKLNSVYTLNTTDATSTVGPCVERDIGQERFLEESPFEIIKSGDYPKVPMLYGVTNMEGLFRVATLNGQVKGDMELMNADFSNYLPADLIFNNEDERNEVTNKIKRFFFGNKVDEEDILDYVNYFSDTIFVYSTLRAINLHVRNGHNEIYLYEYSFTDANTEPVPYTKVCGAGHYSQSAAIWGKDPIEPYDNEPTEEYVKMANIMREIWINFVLTGKPIPDGSGLPEWPAVGRKSSPHMSLGQVLELRGSLAEERTMFWDEIYSRFYRIPQPPPPSL